ncbi:hypothetical protein [Nonomuraea glycinis]|uniref:Uncharacterized protein n=1 Tax=Nonomuraea glycinis TaxID=2047744 RepID=A0A918E7D9_9ACTN|nr:hypothetical protein [Nonomuraea glycinis]GGP12569.1 hypothetical protein GCM10012278_60890 [Nonomuraea glycinis]
MSEFFASLLAKAAVMLLEALIMRFIQSLAASLFRPAGVRLA